MNELNKANSIAIEVAYALPDRQVIIPIQGHKGLSVEEAIHLSEVLKKFPDIDLSENKVGVFGKLVKLDAPLRVGDRVEIYRKLVADPKAARKKRAAKK